MSHEYETFKNFMRHDETFLLIGKAYPFDRKLRNGRKKFMGEILISDFVA